VDLEARKLCRHLLELTLAFTIKESVFRLPRLIPDESRHFPFVRVSHPGYVHFGVLEYQLLFSGCSGVENEQGGFVASAVTADIKLLIVEGEKQGNERLFEIGRQKRPKLVFFPGAIKERLVHAICCYSNSQLAVMVCQPCRDIAGILSNQLFVAGNDVD